MLEYVPETTQYSKKKHSEITTTPLFHKMRPVIKDKTGVVLICLAEGNNGGTFSGIQPHD